MIEIIGYIASALIVLSFTMTSVVKLRIVSFIGCVAFVTYGVLIGAWPIVISNAIIAVINAWFVYKEYTHKNHLAMVPVATDSAFLSDYLASNASDITKLQPGFTLKPDAKVWLLTREGLPAGVFAGRQSGDELDVDLDYVTPAYRDSRMGTYIFGEGSKTFRDLGVSRLVSDPGTSLHRPYLVAMGFTPEGDRMARRI